MDGACDKESSDCAFLMLASCKLCGMTADSRNLDAHHPHRRSKETINVTIPLCRKCHTFIENNVAFEKIQFEDLGLVTAKIKDIMRLDFLFV